MTVSATVDVPSTFDSATGTLTLKGTLLKGPKNASPLVLPEGVTTSDVKKIVVDLLERFAEEDGMENFPKPPNILGVGIKRILEISKLENNEFAQKYGIPQGTVRNWSNGTQKPQRHVLFLLERAVREDTYEPWKTWRKT